MIFAAISTPPPRAKAAQSDVAWLYIGGGLIVVLLLHFLSNRAKKGLLVTAEWATSSHQNKARRQGSATIGKHSPTNAAYYVAEPIGRKRSATPIEEIKKAKVVLPSINRGVLVVGGPGSGKTASLINPALMSAIEQGFSIVLFDFKFGAGGQSESILPFALKHGYKARILAPGFECSNVWNPLDQLKDESDLETARELVSVIVANTTEAGARQDPFFDKAAESIVSAAFLLAKSIAKAENDPDIANLLMVSQILRMDNLGARLQANGSAISAWAEIAASSLISSISADGKNVTEAGLLATAINKIKDMVLPRYLPAMCGQSSFPGFSEESPMTVDGKQIVIFGVDKDRRSSTMPIIATALQQIVSANLRKGRSQPLVISLDEFPTLNLKVALNWLNEDRSNGASLIIGCQYLGQLDARYGKDWAKGFRAGCATKVWFNPGEIETAEILSKTFGEAEVKRDAKSKSYSPGKGGTSRSVAEQLHKKALIEPHTIMELPPGHCYIQSPGVGSGEKVGVPFAHQFKIDGQSAAIEEKESRDIFNKLKVYFSGKSDIIDYGKEARRYSEIINKWLPPSGTAPTSTIEGAALISAIEQVGIIANLDAKATYQLPKAFAKGDADNIEMSRDTIKFILTINEIEFKSMEA